MKGIVITCEGQEHHQQAIPTPDYDVASATMLAGMLDGTLFGYRPRDNPVPGSPLARCTIEGCGAWICCEIVGYEASARA